MEYIGVEISTGGRLKDKLLGRDPVIKKSDLNVLEDEVIGRDKTALIKRSYGA